MEEIEILDDNGIDEEGNDKQKKKSRKRKLNTGMECLICLDNCSITGTHRMISLRCGHLFGKSCIEKWLKTKKKCPSCSGSAKLKDIRTIYATSFTLNDSQTIDKIRLQCEEAVKNKNDLEIQLSFLKEKNINLEKEIIFLNKNINELNNRIEYLSENSGRKDFMLEPDEIIQDGNTGNDMNVSWKYHNIVNYIVSSSSSYQEPLFQFCKSNEFFIYGNTSLSSASFLPIFGLQKVDVRSSMDKNQIGSLHSAPLTGFLLSKNEEMILSTSLDRTVVITDFRDKKKAISYKTNQIARSCCWDTNNDYLFYIGNENGSITQNDVRKNLGETLQILTLQKNKPIHSIQMLLPHAENKETYINLQDNVSNSGFIAGSSSGITIWDKNDRNFSKPKNLRFPAVPAACTSIETCQTSSYKLLFSFRSRSLLNQKMITPKWSKLYSAADVRSLTFSYYDYEMKWSNIYTNYLDDTNGLCRPAIWESSNGRIILCTANSLTGRLCFWDSSTNKKILSLPFKQNNITRIRHSIQYNDWNNENSFLGAMTSDKISIWKYKSD